MQYRYFFTIRCAIPIYFYELKCTSWSLRILAYPEQNISSTILSTSSNLLHMVCARCGKYYRSHNILIFNFINFRLIKYLWRLFSNLGKCAMTVKEINLEEGWKKPFKKRCRYVFKLPTIKLNFSILKKLALQHIFEGFLLYFLDGLHDFTVTTINYNKICLFFWLPIQSRLLFFYVWKAFFWKWTKDRPLCALVSF